MTNAASFVMFIMSYEWKTKSIRTSPGKQCVIIEHTVGVEKVNDTRDRKKKKKKVITCRLMVLSDWERRQSDSFLV